MEQGQNDYVGPGAQLDADNSTEAPVERLMPHVHDIYAALGIEWGTDPFPAIRQLREAAPEYKVTHYGAAFEDGVASVKRLDVEAIARACYAANAVYCQIIGDTPRAWDECKDSVISGVNRALDGATHEELHNAWCDFQTADGWIYGETKDPLAKTHPCLLPYDQLPVEQRNKDQFFLAIVESLKPYL